MAAWSRFRTAIKKEIKMRHPESKVKKVAEETVDEHEQLEQEDFRWLGDIRNALSPYWSSRVVTRADGREVISIEGLHKEER
jgi:hypothetical protein